MYVHTYVHMYTLCTHSHIQHMHARIQATYNMIRMIPYCNNFANVKLVVSMEQIGKSCQVDGESLPMHCEE